jgi:hypothetical protein
MHDDYSQTGPFAELPPGHNIWIRCLRTVTGSELCIKMPRDTYGAGEEITGQWFIDNVPLGFHPHATAVMTDEQADCLEFE